MERGLKAAFIDAKLPSNETDRPRMIANNKAAGVDLLSIIRTQLSACDSFDFCVAFVGEWPAAPR